jgi:cytochrome c peroxidase
MHGWQPAWEDRTGSPEGRARALAAFVLKGLVAPARIDRELSAEEQRGKALFASDRVGCAACHIPDDHYTNRTTTETKLFAGMYKTPSLDFVGGTEPYYHDGSAGTLDALIGDNRDRMGNTNHLSASERGALIAFLRTL